MLNRVRTIIAVIAFCFSSPALPAETDKQVGAICDRVMSLVQAGKVAEAYDASLGSSPLMVGQSTDRESLVGQLQTAFKVFGPASSYELIREQRIGTMTVRRFYFVQHEKMVTRWEIDLARTSGGWVVSYFGYDVKVQEWAADD